MTTATTTWTDVLTAHDACREAVVWAKGYPTFQEAWDACKRADWMFWWAGRVSGHRESAARKQFVLCACACARTVLHHVKAGEDRPRIAIETAERWARDEGGVTLADVRKAEAASSAAAVYASSAAAAVAAYASAVYAASAAAAAAAAACARRRHLSTLADLVRTFYPEPPQ